MASEAPLIIAIDGPSGVGKGTVARRLARRLEIPYFDTGAMYRALALKVLSSGVDPGDREAVVRATESAEVGLAGRDDGSFEVLLDGEPVGKRIRAPAVGEATSRISVYPEIRRRMVELQRRWGSELGGVMEGRDIGTRVFPRAPFKFFLDARPEVRHERRYRQLVKDGREVSREQVIDEISRRDRRDSGRADSPLTYDHSYDVIDTSELTVDEVLERVLAIIEERRARAPQNR